MTGWLAKKKEKFGFIKCDDGSEDCFLLPTEMVGVRFDDVPENAKLEFEAHDHERGRRARNVRLRES